ncbi:MAG: DUF1351 domain-containing protein [Oscillospiraceae bacterium]|nr:DUF1351 domain-containing protein [Oscillospiraceae bacterium]
MENNNKTEIISSDVIIIKQLPVIEEQLQKIKGEVEAATAEALSLICTEDTVKSVKTSRATLNKEFNLFEERRKDVKAQIFAPYEAFEKIYRECIADPFKCADKALAQKIADVENSLKDEKFKAISEFFYEYRLSLGLGEVDAPLKNANINVTLSASLKSLKEQAKKYLDRVQEDISMIATQNDHDEILVEYRKTGNAAQAIMAVSQRHKQIEDERRKADERRAADEARAAAIAKVDDTLLEETVLAAPTSVVIPSVEDIASPVETIEPQQDTSKNIYEVTFTVRGKIEQIKALKEYLNNGGYDFE